MSLSPDYTYWGNRRFDISFVLPSFFFVDSAHRACLSPNVSRHISRWWGEQSVNGWPRWQLQLPPQPPTVDQRGVVSVVSSVDEWLENGASPDAAQTTVRWRVTFDVETLLRRVGLDPGGEHANMVVCEGVTKRRCLEWALRFDPLNAAAWVNLSYALPDATWTTKTPVTTQLWLRPPISDALRQVLGRFGTLHGIADNTSDPMSAPSASASESPFRASSDTLRFDISINDPKLCSLFVVEVWIRSAQGQHLLHFVRNLEEESSAVDVIPSRQENDIGCRPGARAGFLATDPLYLLDDVPVDENWSNASARCFVKPALLSTNDRSATFTDESLFPLPRRATTSAHGNSGQESGEQEGSTDSRALLCLLHYWAQAWSTLGCHLTPDELIVVNGVARDKIDAQQIGLNLFPLLTNAWNNLGLFLFEVDKGAKEHRAQLQQQSSLLPVQLLDPDLCFERCAVLNPRHRFAWNHLALAVTGRGETEVVFHCPIEMGRTFRFPDGSDVFFEGGRAPVLLPGQSIVLPVATLLQLSLLCNSPSHPTMTNIFRYTVLRDRTLSLPMMFGPELQVAQEEQAASLFLAFPDVFKLNQYVIDPRWPQLDETTLCVADDDAPRVEVNFTRADLLRRRLKILLSDPVSLPYRLLSTNVPGVTGRPAAATTFAVMCDLVLESLRRMLYGRLLSASRVDVVSCIRECWSAIATALAYFATFDLAAQRKFVENPPDAEVEARAGLAALLWLLAVSEARIDPFLTAAPLAPPSLETTNDAIVLPSLLRNPPLYFDLAGGTTFPFPLATRLDGNGEAQAAGGILDRVTTTTSTSAQHILSLSTALGASTRILPLALHLRSDNVAMSDYRRSLRVLSRLGNPSTPARKGRIVFIVEDGNIQRRVAMKVTNLSCAAFSSAVHDATASGIPEIDALSHVSSTGEQLVAPYHVDRCLPDSLGEVDFSIEELLALVEPGSMRDYRLQHLDEAQAADVRLALMSRLFTSTELVCIYMPLYASSNVQDALCDVSTDVTIPERMRLVRNTAQAMHFLHSSGIEHGDIKPQNLLLSEWPPAGQRLSWWAKGQSRASLCDFGASRSRIDGPAEVMMFTLLYAAPEIRTAARLRTLVTKAGRRSADVYSAGVTCLEILTRKRGRVRFAALWDHVYVTNVIADCLHPLPQHRCQAAFLLSQFSIRLLQQGANAPHDGDRPASTNTMAAAAAGTGEIEAIDEGYRALCDSVDRMKRECKRVSLTQATLRHYMECRRAWQGTHYRRLVELLSTFPEPRRQLRKSAPSATAATDGRDISHIISALLSVAAHNRSRVEQCSSSSTGTDRSSVTGGYSASRRPGVSVANVSQTMEQELNHRLCLPLVLFRIAELTRAHYGVSRPPDVSRSKLFEASLEAEQRVDPKRPVNISDHIQQFAAMLVDDGGMVKTAYEYHEVPLADEASALTLFDRACQACTHGLDGAAAGTAALRRRKFVIVFAEMQYRLGAGNDDEQQQSLHYYPRVVCRDVTSPLGEDEKSRKAAGELVVHALLAEPWGIIDASRDDDPGQPALPPDRWMLVHDVMEKTPPYFLSRNHHAPHIFAYALIDFPSKVAIERLWGTWRTSAMHDKAGALPASLQQQRLPSPAFNVVHAANSELIHSPFHTGVGGLQDAFAFLDEGDPGDELRLDSGCMVTQIKVANGSMTTAAENPYTFGAGDAVVQLSHGGGLVRADTDVIGSHGEHDVAYSPTPLLYDEEKFGVLFSSDGLVPDERSDHGDAGRHDGIPGPGVDRRALPSSPPPSDLVTQLGRRHRAVLPLHPPSAW